MLTDGERADMKRLLGSLGGPREDTKMPREDAKRLLDLLAKSSDLDARVNTFAELVEEFCSLIETERRLYGLPMSGWLLEPSEGSSS